MGDEALKRRLARSVAVLIAAWNNFVTLLKHFIADVLKCKGCLKQNLNVYALLCIP